MKQIITIGAVVAVTLAAATFSPNGRLIESSAMNVARASHTSDLLPDGRVFISGGFAGSGHEYNPYRSTEIYSPSTGRFTAGPDMNVGRSGHTATVLADGRILLAGGWTGMRDARGTAEIFDPATRRMTPVGRMAVPRAGQSATLLNDGRVLMAGGSDENENPLETAEIFDPKTATFHPTGKMTVPREAHTATLLADGRVAIIGGAMGRYPSETIHRSIELFDPATGRFAGGGTLVVGRYKHASVLLADGQLLVVGGSDNRAWRGQFQSAELYDPRRSESRLTGAMSGKRFKIDGAVVRLADGRVLVGGGANAAELYDPRTGLFSAVPGSLGAARYFAATTRLVDGRVLITGGYADERGQLPSSSAGHLFVP